MDGQDSNYLKQLFGNAQEFPEGSSHHTTTASGSFGNDADGDETAFGKAPSSQTARQLEQGAPGNTIQTGGMPGLTGVAVSHHHFNPIDYHPPGPGWPPSSHSPQFSGSDLTAALDQHAFDTYAFMPYTDAHSGPSSMDPMLLYGTNYAAPLPPDAQPPTNFSYDWRSTIDPSSLRAGTPSIEIGAAATQVATTTPNEAATAAATVGIASPWGLGMAGPSTSTTLGTTTPASFTSGSSSGTVAGFQSATSSEFSEGRPSRRSISGGGARKGREGGRRRAKKPKPMPLPLQMPMPMPMPMPPPAMGSPSVHRKSFGSESLTSLSPLAMTIDSAGGSGSGIGSASLPTVASSSGSRAQPTLRSPKITAPRPSEAKEEKKPRSSHNLVEKQYRNRLNSQFEGLMNALPEKLKSESSGGSEYGDATATLESAEKRLSKAEVLELARRHIQSLEQERDMLERERDGLKGSVTRLKKELEEAAEGGASVEDLLSIEEAIEEAVLKATVEDDNNSIDEASSSKIEDDDTKG